MLTVSRACLFSESWRPLFTNFMWKWNFSFPLCTNNLATYTTYKKCFLPGRSRRLECKRLPVSVPGSGPSRHMAALPTTSPWNTRWSFQAAPNNVIYNARTGRLLSASILIQDRRFTLFQIKAFDYILLPWSALPTLSATKILAYIEIITSF